MIDTLQEKIEMLKLDLKNTTGTECEVYTRIVGYYRPVTMWNKGKAEEYKDRVEFDNGVCGV